MLGLYTVCNCFKLTIVQTGFHGNSQVLKCHKSPLSFFVFYHSLKCASSQEKNTTIVKTLNLIKCVGGRFFDQLNGSNF